MRADFSSRGSQHRRGTSVTAAKIQSGSWFLKVNKNSVRIHSPRRGQQAAVSRKLKETPGHSGPKRGFGTIFPSCHRRPSPSPAVASVCSSLLVKAKSTEARSMEEDAVPGLVRYLELVVCYLACLHFLLAVMMTSEAYDGRWWRGPKRTQQFQ